ncbi:MAG: endonuclease/exonuclease/phosphatase family protein [Candidatus Promineofilum sp.]|uniref:endonuclease/exonuclease/phosphatase family protein n=1 Tax=Promineifilum sp. TaxID=2664178 RepID=UPI0024120B4D|nr:endonuclease/exonuclease/phosphatase family protein [Promineifilum sp.]
MAATPAGLHLTVISANLLNPYCRLGRVDRAALLVRLETFARLVEAERGDVLLCQEVGRSHEFRVDTWLAGRLGMNALYERANGRAERFGREEGLAILSRYPLSDPVSCLLGGGLWRRPALGAVVDTPLGPIAVYTAHLSLRPWRNRRQPARLRGWVEATAGKRPAVIGGDFNAGETSPGIGGLRRSWIDTFRARQPAVGPAATHITQLLGLELARRRIDYIFLRPGIPDIRVVSSSHAGGDEPFSDHLAVVTRFGEQATRGRAGAGL